MALKVIPCCSRSSYFCLTLTLTQLPGVEGVRITVSGAGHSFQNRRVLRAEDVVLADEEKQGEENFEKTS